jgi:hypothetical protein
MFKTNKKKVLVSFSMLALVALFVAADKPTNNGQPKRNLKVLPANISHDSLDYLMDVYKFALNVKCGYCHARSKTNPKKLDMASDENPIKDVARKMIQMTDEMNAKYIHSIQHQPSDTTTLQLVTCNTCHRGEAKPKVAMFMGKQ